MYNNTLTYTYTSVYVIYTHVSVSCICIHMLISRIWVYMCRYIIHQYHTRVHVKCHTNEREFKIFFNPHRINFNPLPSTNFFRIICQHRFVNKMNTKFC